MQGMLLANGYVEHEHDWTETMKQSLGETDAMIEALLSAFLWETMHTTR